MVRAPYPYPLVSSWFPPEKDGKRGSAMTPADMVSCPPWATFVLGIPSSLGCDFGFEFVFRGARQVKANARNPRNHPWSYHNKEPFLDAAEVFALDWLLGGGQPSGSLAFFAS